MLCSLDAFSRLLDNLNAFLSPAVVCFSIIFFFFKHLSVNNLDPDQARRIVRPDLGPNCLQMLSADDISVQTAADNTFKCGASLEAQSLLA